MNKKAATILLIDNSNTRTKLLFSVDGCLQGKPYVIPTNGLSVESLREVAEKMPCSGVVVASVVPASQPIIAAAFSVPVHFLTSADSLPISFDYEGVKTLGADRVANALGLLEKGRRLCVAVDLGTAATFEVVTWQDGSPTFIGGAIAPGLSLMAAALADKTALLPDISFAANASVPGRDTVSSMQAGCLWGTVGMVREILTALASELNEPPYVVATGGDAGLIASKLDLIDEVDPLLTFRGLNVVAQSVFR